MNDIHLQLASMIDEGRLSRAYNIPNEAIILEMIECNPMLFLYATIRGSNRASYRIFIDEANRQFYHDCPDFHKGRGICKHIAKLALSVPAKYAKHILESFYECHIFVHLENIPTKEQQEQIMNEKRVQLINIGDFSRITEILHLMASPALFFYRFGMKTLTEIILARTRFFRKIFARNEKYDYIFKVLLFEIPIHLRDWIFDGLKYESMPKWMESMLQATESSSMHLYSVKISDDAQIFL